MILAIETSDKLTSIALADKGQTLIEYNYNIPMQHATILGQAVQRILSEAASFTNTTRPLPEHVAVAIGPGSFTGLRIGLSFVQGYCFGRDIPVAAISNHSVLANQVPAGKKKIYSLIDARRKEVYLAEHIARDGFYSMRDQRIVKIDALAEHITAGCPIVLSPGLDIPGPTFRELQKKGCIFFDRPTYRASHLAIVAGRYIAGKQLIRADELEPMYIRAFGGVL